MREEIEKSGKTEKEIDEQHREANCHADAARGDGDGRCCRKHRRNTRSWSIPTTRSRPLEPRRGRTCTPIARICHVEAGGGNAQFNVDFFATADKMKLVDVAPQHHTFGLKDARLIAPGQPERSVLLHRVGTREQGHMPPLATFLVDREGTTMLREWVRSMKPLPK